MKKPGCISLALGFLLMGRAALHSQTAAVPGAGQVFKFNFEPGKPLVYEVNSVVKYISKPSIPGKYASTVLTTTYSSAFKLKLTPTRTNADGSFVFQGEAVDFTAEKEVLKDTPVSRGGGFHMKASLKGDDYVVKQDGKVLVDTANGIGLTNPVVSREQVFTDNWNRKHSITPSGAVPQKEGKFSTLTRPGFFIIVFPDSPVALGESWTNLLETTAFPGSYVPDDKAAPLVKKFVREKDIKGKDGPLASFKVDFNEKFTGGRAGPMDENGKPAMLCNGAKMSSKATFQFDPAAGHLTELSQEEKMTASINRYEGIECSGSMEYKGQISMRLVSP